MTNNKPVIHPYLDFDGRCEEALDFYRKAVGAEVLMLMRFKDAPEPARAQCGPVSLDKVMHSRVRIGDSDIMASDGRCTGKPNFHGIALSLTAPDPAAAERAFKALSDGGSVTMPLSKTFFSPAFGMVADKFGVGWMVYVEGQRP
jgi:PhnB protein